MRLLRYTKALKNIEADQHNQKSKERKEKKKNREEEIVVLLPNYVHLPADHTEPRKSVVKWITSRDGFDIEIWRRRREFGLVVIHLAHQFQPLPGKQMKLTFTTIFV